MLMIEYKIKCCECHLKSHCAFYLSTLVSILHNSPQVEHEWDKHNQNYAENGAPKKKRAGGRKGENTRKRNHPNPEQSHTSRHLFN